MASVAQEISQPLFIAYMQKKYLHQNRSEADHRATATSELTILKTFFNRKYYIKVNLRK